MANPFDVSLPAVGAKPWTLNPAIVELRNRISAGDDSLTSSISEVNGQISGIGVYMTATKYPSLLTDAGAAIMAVYNSLPDGSTIYVQPGRFPVRSGVIWDATRNISIRGYGTYLYRIEGSFTIFTVTGGYGAQIPVSALAYDTQSVLGVNTAVTRLTVSGPTGLVTDDTVKLFADDAIPGGRKTANDATSFPRVGWHLRVLSASNTEVVLQGKPVVDADNYTTNIKIAKLLPSGFTCEGIGFDVDDSIISAGTTAPAVIRIEAVKSPALRDVKVLRGVGPIIQMRSNLGYLIENVEIGRGLNNGGTILGYGIQDNGSQGGNIVGGNVWFVRHAYDDKSYESAANSTYTAGYGRTLFPVISGLKGWYSSSATFSTHQESYGVHFNGCTVAGTGLAGGFSLRGSGHKVSNAYVSNVDTAVTVQTETEYPTGESRDIDVTNLTVENAVIAVQANIRLGTVHNSAGVQDTQRNLTVNGLVARNVRAVVIAQNAKVALSNLDVRIADNPSVNTFDYRNSELHLGGVQRIDGLGVTVSPSTSHSLIKSSSPTDSVSPRNLITQSGQMYFDPSAYWAGRFTGGLFVPESNTDVDFPMSNSLSITKAISAGILPSSLSYRKQFTFGWRYVPHDDNSNRFTGSGDVIATNSQISGTTAVRVVTSAPNDTLLLRAVMNDGVNRTLAALPSGRRPGQRLTVLVVASTTEQLTINNGSSAGTTMPGSSPLVLSNSGQARFFWGGSSWRLEV